MPCLPCPPPPPVTRALRRAQPRAAYLGGSQGSLKEVGKFCGGRGGQPPAARPSREARHGAKLPCSTRRHACALVA